jgi:hypothetical protein
MDKAKVNPFLNLLKVPELTGIKKAQPFTRLSLSN